VLCTLISIYNFPFTIDNTLSELLWILHFESLKNKILMETLTRNGYTRTMQRNDRNDRNGNNRRHLNSYNNRYSGDGYDNGDASARNYWPPRDWRSFTEIKFKVSKVHTNAEVTELREAFAAYGSVYKVQIETKDTDNGEIPTGVVYVIFKFV
jgi:hypothetical protein